MFVILSHTKTTGMTSACPVEEGLDESWFTDQMDHDGVLVTQEKPKKPR